MKIARHSPWVAVLLLAGCSAATVRYADRSVTSDMVQERVEENHTRLRTLLGNGTISVETPDVAQSGSFELRLRKPDSVLMHIEGPFGIDVGSALLTPDEFLFYSSLNNKLVTGPMNPESLGKVLGVGLSFTDMMNLFSGGVFFLDDHRTPSVYEIESEEIVFTYHHPQGTRRYWVDPGTFQITRIHHIDALGKLIAEQQFSKFRNIDGVTLPQYIRLTMPKDRRRISIAYGDMMVNPSNLRLQFDVPANASRSRLEQ